MKELTDKTYWDETYKRQGTTMSLDFSHLRNYPAQLILEKIIGMNLHHKTTLEIGAGNSTWLLQLSGMFPKGNFVGLDYSEIGCRLLAKRAAEERLNIRVVQEDFLETESDLHGNFDVTLSFGVVEHFGDLCEALHAKSRYLKSGGIMFTLIPNLSGLVGLLVKRWNPEVYQLHNPHDLRSFLEGHHQAGLKVLSSGYLVSNSFGVLSSCFPERKGLAWQISRCLVAASMAIWWIESKIGRFPARQFLSPYIFAISSRQN